MSCVEVNPPGASVVVLWCLVFRHRSKCREGRITTNQDETEDLTKKVKLWITEVYSVLGMDMGISVPEPMIYSYVP